MSTDAFAAAAAAQQGNTGTASTDGQGETQAVTADLSGFGGVDSPFLTSSDVNTGGDLTPHVPFEDIVGRLVVMIPQRFQEKTKVKLNGAETLKATADVDMFVLDGGPFSFEYKVPAPTATDPNAVKYETMQVEEIPYGEKGRRLFSAGLAWSVGRALAQRGILYGIMAYGPQNATARKAGATIDTVTAAVQQWIDRGRKGDGPKFTWVLDDRAHVFTDARKAIAGAWWNEYRKTL